MDDLLSPVSTTYTSGSKKATPLLKEVKPTHEAAAAAAAPERQRFTATSADEALEILRNEPYYDTLASILRFLCSSRASFDVRKPSPLSAQIVQVLVTAILPNYWTLLHEDHLENKDGGLAVNKKKNTKRGRADTTDLELFLKCLRSITGLSALLVRLRALLAEAKTSSAKEQTYDAVWQLKTVVQVVSELLVNESSVSELWTASVSGTETEAQRRPLSQEFLNVLGGGRVVSLSAEAEAVVSEKPGSEKSSPSWTADGKAYSCWLTRSIIQWSLQAGKSDQKLRGDLLSKAMRLGYPDAVVSTLVSDLLLGGATVKEASFSQVLEQLPAREQKKILAGTLKCVSDSYIHTSTEDASIVSAVAGLIKAAIGNNGYLQEQLGSWLATAAGVGWDHGVIIRRAVISVVAANKKSLSEVLDKVMVEFGDQLFIKHVPILQQEAKAQVLLLSAGYIHRSNPRALVLLLRSRTYLDIVSNRLGASQNRARFLGMVVGEALSGLVDDSQKKLDFHMDETESEDAIWYKGLVRVSDTIGSIDLLRSPPSLPKAHEDRPKPRKITAKPINRPARVPPTTGFVIEEIDDDEDEGKNSTDEDDDLVPYGAPDSDAEDSDDDPTMIRRDKPKAPVYIRGLIAYFRDTENYDKQRLALTTAPVLIRRKANFGTEVQQHAQDLASILIGLHDSYDMDDFYKLQMQGMVALVVSQPKLVGPSFVATFFAGDYSLAQRASVLTALGLSARELAGFEVSEYASAAAFPSKQLPSRVERLYISPGDSAGRLHGSLPASSSLKALPPGALDAITDSLTAGFLGPIAAKAADEATGPDVLKLSSFKSRVEMSSGKLSKKTKPIVRPATANTAAQTIAAAFFFPLVARFQLAVQSSSSARLRSVLFEPSILSLYLKTLAVVMHAVGPSALSLPDMTAELWGLLLGSSVQAHCVGDVTVTHAVLFALLALLDVNEGRMRNVCRDLAREVVQTRDWLLQVLDATRGADSDSGSQESQIQMLAAGTYIRLTEGMESYRSLLLGEMIG